MPRKKKQESVDIQTPKERAADSAQAELDAIRQLIRDKKIVIDFGPNDSVYEGLKELFDQIFFDPGDDNYR